jgi:Na+/phosphate symporter
MDKLFESFLNLIGLLILGPLTAIARAVVSVVEWPAAMLGIQPEIMAVVLCCVVFLAFWRALGPVIK